MARKYDKTSLDIIRVDKIKKKILKRERLSVTMTMTMTMTMTPIDDDEDDDAYR